MQEAQLRDFKSQVVATVEVPAFPTAPDIVCWAGRCFKGAMIGYGVTYLTYREGTFYQAEAALEGKE